MAVRRDLDAYRRGQSHRRLLATALAAALCAVPFLSSVGSVALPLRTAFAQTETASGEGEPEGGWPELVEPLAEPMAVIPPGHEDFLAEMLGRGATLPGGCSFASGQIAHDKITVTYRCSGDEVAFVLQHPSKAPPQATITRRFAITLGSGSPPAGLGDELASRVRAREREFEWTWIGPEARGRWRIAMVATAAVLAIGFASWLIVRRSRQQARTS